MAALPIRIWVMAADDSADFTLSVSAADDKGEPIYSLGAVKINDENINQRLRDMFQSFRAGMYVGKLKD